MPVYFFLLCLPLVFGTNEWEVANPLAHFKPELNYRARENTGLVILSLLKKPKDSSINNPYLQKSSFHFDDFMAHAEKATLSGKPLVFRQNGKSRQVPLKAGNYTLQIKDGPPLNLRIQTGEIRLILTLQQNESGPAKILIGQSLLQSKENPEFESLYRDMLEVNSRLIHLIQKKIKPQQIIHPDFRDALGKASDFAQYLEIRLKHIAKAEIRVFRLLKLEQGYQLHLEARGLDQGHPFDGVWQIALNSNRLVTSVSKLEAQTNP